MTKTQMSSILLPGHTLPNGYTVILAAPADATHDAVVLAYLVTPSGVEYATWKWGLVDDGPGTPFVVDTYWGHYRNDLVAALDDFHKRSKI